MLIADSVGYSFGQTKALAEASATVVPGEKLALVGPSGSGKTTFLYCLAGLLRPESGHVEFEGRDLARMTDDARSALRLRSFGFVFQFAELVPELTLRENVALPMDLAGVPRARRTARVRDLLDRLGLADHADRRPAQVSGGQAQRAAVARAVAHRPAVVFADEPTGSLDSANGEVVIDVLFELAQEQGSAVVLVTHDPAVAGRADRVVELRDGRVLTGARPS
jgi:putative ABC transport system ATP-binding protein